MYSSVSSESVSPQSPFLHTTISHRCTPLHYLNRMSIRWHTTMHLHYGDTLSKRFRYHLAMCFHVSIGLKDYCPTDSFDAHCHPNESVVVTSAQYGRMSTGNCLDGKGYTGCVADVRSHLANLCSGRQRCTVAVSTLASVVQPCDRDYVSYLEASYKCVNGQY